MSDLRSDSAIKKEIFAQIESGNLIPDLKDSWQFKISIRAQKGLYYGIWLETKYLSKEALEEIATLIEKKKWRRLT